MPARDRTLHAECGCRSCPTAARSIVARTPAACDVAIVLDAPADGDVKRQAWLTGKRGGPSDLLRQVITGISGQDIEEFYVCSALNCRPNMKKKAMVKKAMISCRERLIDELRDAGVKKVLCVGVVGYSALMSSDKLLAITNVRGRWKQAFGMDILATLPPEFVLGASDYYRDFAYDIEKFFTTEPQPTPDVELWVPETLKEVAEAFDWLGEAKSVSVDLETTGFSPVASDILAAGFGVLNGADAKIVILDNGVLAKTKPWRLIGELLARDDQDTIFHNAKFDLQHLKDQLSVRRRLRYEPRSIQDTLLLHYCLDERPIGRFKCHGLEAISRVHYDAPDYGIDVAKFIKEWEVADNYNRRAMREKLHVYLGLDCYYTARAFPDFWNAAMREDEKLLDLYEDLLVPAAIALADIEHHGILVDREFYEATSIELGGKARKLLAKIQRKTGIKDFNPGSPKQVKEYIYDDLGMPFGLRKDKDGKVYHTARRGGLQEGATAAPVLKALAYRYPEHKGIIDDIVEYRNLTKNIGTYVNGILNRIDVDGRIRSSFNLAGTSTGRLSSSNPNLQNVPDASHTGVEIRAGFIPPPGHVFIEADYKQLEVRVAAWLSDDATMKEIFVSGRDPHQEIAHSIYHKPKEEVTHYMRWLAKNILFGLLYGRGYESVATGPEQEDIAARGGQRWGLDEVKMFYDNLLAEWKDFAAWQKNQKHIGYTEAEIIMPTGRRRRFGFIPKHDNGYVGRASFNNPIQGTASDFTLYALLQLHARLPEGAHLVLTVHDSLAVECREELVDEVSALIEEIMTTDTLFDIDVPLAVDIDVEYRWGQKEFEKQHKVIADEEPEVEIADVPAVVVDA
jgi:DNA polymerase-1